MRNDVTESNTEMSQEVTERDIKIAAEHMLYNARVFFEKIEQYKDYLIAKKLAEEIADIDFSCLDFKDKTKTTEMTIFQTEESLVNGVVNKTIKPTRKIIVKPYEDSAERTSNLTTAPTIDPKVAVEKLKNSMGSRRARVENTLGLKND